MLPRAEALPLCVEALPLHAEALLLQLKALLLSLKALLLPKGGKSNATIGKNVSFYLFFL
jgi:hypothetical protein